MKMRFALVSAVAFVMSVSGASAADAPPDAQRGRSQDQARPQTQARPQGQPSSQGQAGPQNQQRTQGQARSQGQTTLQPQARPQSQPRSQEQATSRGQATPQPRARPQSQPRSQEQGRAQAQVAPQGQPQNRASRASAATSSPNASRAAGAHVQASGQASGARANIDVHTYQRNVTAQRHFNAGTYRAPQGYSYRRWSYGQNLPAIYFGRNYWINDYNSYDLIAPPYGYVWVRFGPDALLINEYSGEIVQVDYGVFY